MSNRSQILGRTGEELAAQHLSQKGYEIIKRNFRVPGGEIDIIAKDRGVLVFIEVKNYSYKNFYLPMYSVGYKKRLSIYRAAEEYLYRNDIMNNDCRFDIVWIYKDEEKLQRIELIKNAFI
ncbi:YraN family protein [Candidatus Margulisiibacteriota bacterium]